MTDELFTYSLQQDALENNNAIWLQGLHQVVKYLKMLFVFLFIIC